MFTNSTSSGYVFGTLCLDDGVVSEIKEITPHGTETARYRFLWLPPTRRVTSTRQPRRASSTVLTVHWRLYVLSALQDSCSPYGISRGSFDFTTGVLFTGPP